MAAMGCAPVQLASSRSQNGECTPQKAATILNPLLLEMLQGLNQELGSDVFITANVQLYSNCKKAIY
ncbi:hypothetical protein SAY87_004375 [Trapa incisa]|uniref:Uncharacterized protein n=1 Tax=Trapa incisa TaxID=236973 RepID=A0AAN7JSB1_9MYRT|nr:hypothetical protein SAY87_004375 [Trapa incisa]